LTAQPQASRFGPVAENYLIPQKDLAAYVDAGAQSRVPVLQASNSEERSASTLLEKNPPTPEGFAAAVRKTFGADADRVLKRYPAKTEAEVLDAAMTLASDQGMAYGMWRLAEGHRKVSGKPVYRYLYTRPRPKFLGAANQTPGVAGGVVTTTTPSAAPSASRGAVHSAEIEYALGNLSTNKRYAWEAGDYKVSEVMGTFFANFIKTGDPNGPGVPKWPAYGEGSFQIMYLDGDSHAGPEKRDCYLLLDQILRKK